MNLPELFIPIKICADFVNWVIPVYSTFLYLM